MPSTALGDGGTLGLLDRLVSALLQLIVERRVTVSNYTHIFNFKFGPCQVEKKVFVVEKGEAELLSVWGG